MPLGVSKRQPLPAVVCCVVNSCFKGGAKWAKKREKEKMPQGVELTTNISAGNYLVALHIVEGLLALFELHPLCDPFLL